MFFGSSLSFLHFLATTQTNPAGCDVEKFVDYSCLGRFPPPPLGQQPAAPVLMFAPALNIQGFDRIDVLARAIPQQPEDPLVPDRMAAEMYFMASTKAAIWALVLGLNLYSWICFQTI